MKFKSFLLIQKITILIIIIIISLSFSQKSSIIPIYKIILTENMTNLEFNSLFNLYLNLKGMGIILDNSSNINIMPMYIFKKNLQVLQ